MSHYDQRLGATFKPKVPKLLWRLSNWAPTPFPRPQQLPWPRADCPPPPRVCHPREPSESSLCPLETEILLKPPPALRSPPRPWRVKAQDVTLSSKLCTWDSPSEGSNQTAKLSPPTETPERSSPFVGGGGSGAAGGAHLAHARLLTQLRGPRLFQGS